MEIERARNMTLKLVDFTFVVKNVEFVGFFVKKLFKQGSPWPSGI